MPQLIILFLVIVFPVMLLAFAWIVGRVTAARHEADLSRRQTAVAHILVHDTGRLVDAVPGPNPPAMITSELTLGIDHFRGFLGQWKSLFGGDVRSYQVVFDRARREVMTRLLEQALARRYNAVANVRIDFADIGGSSTAPRKAAQVSVMAAGTADHTRLRT